MLRKRIHQLIDELPDEKLTDLLAILQDFQKYDAYIPRLGGLPIFETENAVHGKIFIDKYGPSPQPSLSLISNTQSPKNTERK